MACPAVTVLDDKLTNTNMEPNQEAAIDHTLDHYLEEQALLCAMTKAKSDRERDLARQLMLHRETLMTERAEHIRRVTAKRHARGEFYSDTKIKSINSMMLSREELDQVVRGSFESQPDFANVLRNHALAHVGVGLVSNRSQLAYAPEDVADDLRAMLVLEEAFAAEWVKAINDPAFQTELNQRRRETMTLLRTSKTSMFLVTEPVCPITDSLDAAVLGRAWNKLDSLARTLGMKPLSTFVGIDGQANDDSSYAEDILPTVDALIAALQDSQQKLPGKKATAAELTRIRDVLLWLQTRNGRAYFEVDL